MKKAFTLIELLVVMLILGLVIGLVAPKGFKLLQSINKKIEKKKLIDVLKESQYKAFLTEKPNNKFGINEYGIKKKFYSN